MTGEASKVYTSSIECPNCGEHEQRVRDSRGVRKYNAIRRTRECVICGFNFLTIEIAVHVAKSKGTQ